MRKGLSAQFSIFVPLLTRPDSIIFSRLRNQTGTNRVLTVRIINNFPGG